MRTSSLAPVQSWLSHLLQETLHIVLNLISITLSFSCGVECMLRTHGRP